MTDTIDLSFESDPDLLLAETGDADDALVLGLFDGADTDDGGPVPMGGPLGRSYVRWLTDLADAVRSSGLRTVETAGWKTRGHAPMQSVSSFAAHHTATSNRATGNYPTLRVVRDGRPGLEGPLAQLGMGRDGTVYVIAAGKAWHAGPTYQWWEGNSHAIGVEIEGDGRTEFTAAQKAAIPVLFAALCKWYNEPAERCTTHKEIAKPHYRKTDPYGLSQAELRRQVRAVMDKPAAEVQVTVEAVIGARTNIKVAPKTVAEDGYYGPRTHSAFMAAIGGDPLVGMTRDNVRDVQTWCGRARTGHFTRDDYKAIQSKVGAPVDGDWPHRWGTKRPSTTTRRIQAWINQQVPRA